MLGEGWCALGVGVSVFEVFRVPDDVIRAVGTLALGVTI